MHVLKRRFVAHPIGRLRLQLLEDLVRLLLRRQGAHLGCFYP